MQNLPVEIVYKILDELPEHVQYQLIDSTPLGVHCCNNYYQHFSIVPNYNNTTPPIEIEHSEGIATEDYDVSGRKAPSVRYMNLLRFEKFLKLHPRFQPNSVHFASFGEFTKFYDKFPDVMTQFKQIKISDIFITASQLSTIDVAKIPNINMLFLGYQVRPNGELSKFLNRLSNLRQLQCSVLENEAALRLPELEYLETNCLEDFTHLNLKSLTVTSERDIVFDPTKLPQSLRTLTLRAGKLVFPNGFSLKNLTSLVSLKFRAPIPEIQFDKALLHEVDCPRSLQELTIENSGPRSISAGQNLSARLLVPNVRSLSLRKFFASEIERIQFPKCLRHLELFNVINGTVSLPDLPCLMSLSLKLVTPSIETLQFPPSLVELSLLQFDFPSLIISDLKNLKRLTLQSCHIPIMQLPSNLISFVVRGSLIKDIVCPKALECLEINLYRDQYITYNKSLKRLVVFLNDINALDRVRNLPTSLRYLRIDNDPFSAPSKPPVLGLESLVNLETFESIGTHLDQNSVKFPFALRKLILSENMFTQLPDLPNLVTLDLSCNKVNINQIEVSKSLRSLILAENFGDDTLDLDLSGSRLKYLNFRGCGISGNRLKLPSSLETLSLYMNRFRSTDWVDRSLCPSVSVFY